MRRAAASEARAKAGAEKSDGAKVRELLARRIKDAAKRKEASRDAPQQNGGGSQPAANPAAKWQE